MCRLIFEPIQHCQAGYEHQYAIRGLEQAKEQGAAQQEAIAEQIGNFKKAFDLKGEYHFSELTSKAIAK